MSWHFAAIAKARSRDFRDLSNRIGVYVIKIKKGLAIPISGAPSNQVEAARPVSSVAVIGPDYVDMKPTMVVKEGDQVKIGQVLFECKKTPGLFFTAPASGKVTGINRGERRAFQTVTIACDGEEHLGFSSHRGKSPKDLGADDVRALLIESGMWSCIRQRPFEKTPSLNSTAHSVFVSVIDTQPLAMPPSTVISARSEDFQIGLEILAKLPSHHLHVCKDSSSLKLPTIPNLKVTEFQGIHPAGNVGTHIHFLEPVNPNKSVWHVGYQDVIAIGHLFRTGKLDTERWVAIGGPRMKNPRILKTRIGANLQEVLSGEVNDSKTARLISGSVLNGRRICDTFAYLGRFHNAACAIEEDNKRELLGWHTPGFDRFSQKPIYVSRLMPGKSFALGSSTHGSPRAMVPTGSFEEVTPLDILPTQLLRALLSNDTDTAQDLGCLELAEEDLALYTFVSPGKIDFGPVLRENLSKIEKEG